MSFEPVLEARAALGESPVWCARRQALFFVDINGRRLHRFEPSSGEHQSFPVAEDIGCVALANGGFVAGMRSGIWLLDEQGKQQRKLADNPEDQAESRFNDGAVDPVGRLFAGTIDEPKRTSGAHLYRLDRRGLAVIAGGLLTSNGVAFSPDGRTMYHADTPRFVVYRYDYDSATGSAENRRVFIQLDAAGADRGRPDGGTVDAEGCYWTALYEGARVERYDPDGKLMARYPVAARNPTMPRFGGPDLKTLYLTTAGHPGDPHPGAVFAMPADTPGLAAPDFDPAP